MELSGDTEFLSIQAGGREWIIERFADLDTLWEQMDEEAFLQDERLPYWAEVWPSSLLLTDWIMQHADLLSGKRILDLGCGLGLTALAGAACGAQVVGVDYEADAVKYALRNASHNKVPEPLFVVMDWREIGFLPDSFDYVFCGDVFYEKRFFEPLRNIFETVLTPEGRVWVGEPGRNITKDVWAWLESFDFTGHVLTSGPVPMKDYQARVTLREFHKKTA